MSSQADDELYAAAVGRKAGYRWVTARVQQAKAEFAFDRERQLEFLAQRGGPNLAVPLLVFLAIVLVTFVRPAGMLQ